MGEAITRSVDATNTRENSMSEKFYNPYQFIPVRAPNKLTPYKSLDELKQIQNKFVRHDFWQRDGLSGRILCSLTLESPTFVGGTHSDNKTTPQVVDGYKGNFNGKMLYMLPANSLRGMVGQVAESLSQSALRVLENKNLSVRKEVTDSLPAIGRLVKCQPKEGYANYAIQPLTFATRWQYKNKAFSILELKGWYKHFKGRNLQKILPVYLDGYKTNLVQSLEQHSYQKNSFLEREKPQAFPAKDSQDKLIYYYAKLHPELANYTADDEIPEDLKGLYIKNNKFLIGQRLLNADQKNSILNSLDFANLPNDQKGDYTKGIVRVLDVLEHSGNIPNTKKHELFIPWPDDLEKNGTPTKLLPIRQTIEDNFIQLVEQAHQQDEQFPVLLKGYKSAKLCRNKLFYFNVDEKGLICDISLSAIWRQSVGMTYDYFNTISPDLLPWNKTRSALTPVEALWGVVQEDKADQQDSRSLASRLRFSDAVPIGITEAEQQISAPVTLKILSSPKTPCPAMYFHTRQGEWITKTALNPDNHQPNGRKVYLHHYQQTNYRATAWATDEINTHIDQKVKITPLKAGQTFDFFIDFENISHQELGLLQASLEPSKNYRHKLGMGKPLGLGSVNVQIQALLLIDRSTRYQVSSLNTLRYSTAWLTEALDPTTQPAHTYHKLKDYPWDKTLVDQEACKNIAVSGDPSQLQKELPISYPIAIGQASETEGFTWFAHNTSTKGQPKQQMLGTIKGKLPMPLQKNKVVKFK